MCRAGATTLAELAAAGTPAILVPLPTATDDHQRKNAEVVGRAGAAVVVEERDLTGGACGDALSALVADGSGAARWRGAARRWRGRTRRRGSRMREELASAARERAR